MPEGTLSAEAKCEKPTSVSEPDGAGPERASQLGRSP